MRLMLIALLALAGPLRALPKLTYVVRVLPARSEWRVLVIGEGIDASIRDVGVFLPAWGDWLKLGPRVLTSFSCEPPAEPVAGTAGRFRLRVPPGWNGKLRAVYSLSPARIGSRELSEAPLVVRRAADFELGFARGTLLGLSEQIYEQPAVRTLFVIPPPGWWCATGYAPVRRGPDRMPMDDGYHNGVIAVGRAPRVARGRALDTPIEVVQLGAGPLAAPQIRDTLAAAWTRLCRETGDIPLPRVAAVLLPVASWSTFTPNGTHLGFELDDRIEHGRPLDVGYARIAVHELAHAWTGFAITPAEPGMEWFTEGFTEYLALQTLARMGPDNQIWFARALLGLRRKLESNRKAATEAFLGERRDWRVDDAVEGLIYDRAPLVAFALDVALRRRGHGGVAAMVGDLIHAGGRLDRAALRVWLAAHGMQDFTARHLAAAGMPDVVADLAAVGVRVTRAATALTDLGLRLEGDAPLVGVVAEVERGGPADRAGVRKGERIFGASPLRDGAAIVEGPSPGRYSYGLKRFEPGVPVRLHVDAGKGTRVVSVAPRARPGGWMLSIAADRHSPTIPYFFINR